MRIDYLVVGAGASGCALANRLSEDPDAQVLLVERGRLGASPVTLVPRALPFALRPPRLDSYEAHTDDENVYWVRGRGLGGSTTLNGMLYLRGEPAGYEAAEAAGGSAWSWPAFAAAYDEIEQRFVHPTLSSLNALDERIIETISALGAARVTDLNRSSGSRVGASPATIARGIRRSSAHAFLAAQKTRPNLRVITGVDVDSLIWRGSAVCGIRARHHGQIGEIRAHTVILCAGAIESPLLLERSGIGNGALLREAGIDVRVESPLVGERLIEQRGHGLQLRLKGSVADSMELASPSAQAIQTLRYLLTLRGAMARPAYDVVAMLCSEGAVRPDIVAMATPFGLHPSGAMRPAPYPSVLLNGYAIQPETTSSVHLRPDDPQGPPVIEARYEQTARDQAVAEAVRATLRRIAGSSPLSEVVDCADDAAPANTGSSVYHSVGSAAMGPGDEDVVDSALRVRGVDRLHIADLSVLPRQPSATTAGPAMALGWLAGGVIAASR